MFLYLVVQMYNLIFQFISTIHFFYLTLSIHTPLYKHYSTKGGGSSFLYRITMIEVKVKEEKVRTAANTDMDAFVQVFVDAIHEAIGGQLTNENLGALSPDQITLLGWSYLHTEVMDGGYVQLIHNGYGAFFFKNPFAVAMRNWGLTDLYSHIRKAKRYYEKYRNEIECEMSDDDFMALYEQMPEFDELDDDFIVNEEQWMAKVAEYVDDHIEDFVVIEQ